MLKNYLRTAFRNLWRHQGFSLLNIIGLTIGMVAFYLIFLYVSFELSYDTMHTKADRIYRMVADIKTPDGNLHTPICLPGPSRHTIGQIPEVETAMRFQGDNWLVTREISIFMQDDVADGGFALFLQVFDFPLMKGNPQDRAKGPIQRRTHRNDGQEILRRCRPDGAVAFAGREKFHATVTGVMKDIPDNTSSRPV